MQDRLDTHSGPLTGWE